MGTIRSGAGETDSEMFNATSTLNICSRNYSLAVLVKAVSYLRRDNRDTYPDVFDRVLDFRRSPRVAFRSLCHLEWGFYSTRSLWGPYLVPYRVPGPNALYKVILETATLNQIWEI